jgi:hypothetical protein
VGAGLAAGFSAASGDGTTCTRDCCTIRHFMPVVSSLRLVTCVRPSLSRQLQIVTSSVACAAASAGTTLRRKPEAMKNRRTINNIPEKNEGRAKPSLVGHRDASPVYAE